jgi:hypothetical protein
MVDYKIADMQSEMMRKQGAKNRAAGTRNALISAGGGILAAGIGAAI